MEIGSEFNIAFENIEKVSDNIYRFLSDYDSIYLDSGRSAIKLVLKLISSGEILLPEYICESVIKSFEGFKINYYKINEDFSIDVKDLKTKINKNTKALFIMHYYGSLQQEYIVSEIKDLKLQWGFMIIEDTTHCIFTKSQIIGDYCVCSLRKWFAIPDGGVLYSLNSLDILKSKNFSRNIDINKIYGMVLKNLYLEYGIDVNSLYRMIFCESEELLDSKMGIQRISYMSELLLNCYDIKDMINKRRNNYNTLVRMISDLDIILPMKFSSDDCPFTLPIYHSKRNDLRKYLIENKIYCAIHWPISECDYNNNIFKKVISLPLDQRYNYEHMKYLFEKIKQYEELNNDYY